MKALWSLVPVSADTLAGELDLFVSFVYYFAEAKVSDLDFSVVKYNVLGFQVKVDYFLAFTVVQVFQPT